jgi:hypothetical protein
MRPQPDVVHMRTGAAMFDQKIGHPLHRKRTNLPDIGSIVQNTGSNRLIELKRLINELDRGNQHKVKVSRFAAQIKQPQKIRNFSDRGPPLSFATSVL